MGSFRCSAQDHDLTHLDANSLGAFRWIRAKAGAAWTAAAVLVISVVATVLTGCGSPPQVVEISPQRGAVDVRSSEAVRVRFDRPMDRTSVASHFHVEPHVQGQMRWASDSELTFEHAAFAPSSQYQVVLDPGYRDAQGGTNPLRHSWTFHTEAPPALAGSTPGPGDRDVDPASYVTLAFSREIDLASLSGAVTLTPSIPLALHQDPADGRRVILAPQALLQPRTSYSVTVGTTARDVDGNRLGAPAAFSFTTGAFRPLRHWISFVASPTPTAAGIGLWIVDENRVPRQLISSPVTAFSWSADGSRLLLRSPTGGWADQPLDGLPAALPFQADWADFLAPGTGYAYLERGTLRLLEPDGSVITVATDVTEAAIAPGGERLAFATRTEIDGYDTALRTRYRLQLEQEPVDGLAWAPDGQSLAYRLDATDTARRQLRVRSLRDGSVVTVATGDVSAPVWQADRQHVFFTSTIASSTGPAIRAFRAAVSAGTGGTLAAGPTRLSDQDVRPGSLSLSADGHQLAFLSDTDGVQPGVWEMNADGTGVTRLTDPDPASFPYSCDEVAWTPS